MSTFFTETLTRALPGLIDSNDTRADATATDMAADKKGHTRRDIRTRYAAGRATAAGAGRQIGGKWIFIGRVVERCANEYLQ